MSPPTETFMRTSNFERTEQYIDQILVQCESVSGDEYELDYEISPSYDADNEESISDNEEDPPAYISDDEYEVNSVDGEYVPIYIDSEDSDTEEEVTDTEEPIVISSDEEDMEDDEPVDSEDDDGIPTETKDYLAGSLSINSLTNQLVFQDETEGVYVPCNHDSSSVRTAAIEYDICGNQSLDELSDWFIFKVCYINASQDDISSHAVELADETTKIFKLEEITDIECYVTLNTSGKYVYVCVQFSTATNIRQLLHNEKFIESNLTRTSLIHTYNNYFKQIIRDSLSNGTVVKAF